MTAIILGLLAIAIYFQWTTVTVGIIAACSVVALALDTRAILSTRKSA
ncbi:hypothetical protein [Corynebacterium endometrii]|uniref:Uncharacterized protein n=1 Tax=Corynebacterium endometrii TaxID=2488819 RepID=A0A4P7QJA4_9CORY|nr:hypothetical protein [Corynebacterium endometrii]QCB28857.1 hypothetical protein CENDO_07915 [Corynebacterium endometrii]